MDSKKDFAEIPMKNIGPIKIIGEFVDDEITVPLATFESPLWPSTNRGAKVTRAIKGLQVSYVKENMTRSILLEAPNATAAIKIVANLKHRYKELSAIVSQTSNFAKLEDWTYQIVGNLLFLRFSMTTGDASGHNMTTKAAEYLLNWILQQYSQLKYVSISANICTDKKVSSINGLLGRGKYVVAEGIIPEKICHKFLRTSPHKIVDLNIKKNLIGTNIAGGLRCANAHYANMLFAFYLSTGQDVANIIEGSQGITHAELKDNSLYFTVTLPNIIVGTVGNGKNLPFVKKNLAILGCDAQRPIGHNARRLAIIAAATVWCGELSLMAAQTNPGELMRSHITLERASKENNHA